MIGHSKFSEELRNERGGNVVGRQGYEQVALFIDEAFGKR